MNIDKLATGLAIIVLVLSPINSKAATLYMGAGETYTNLQSAVAAMSGGDTLIIRDGTYSGSTNYLDNAHMPPSGSAGSYTIIRAENDGGAVFTSGFLWMQYTTSRNYVQIEGIKVTSATPTAQDGGTYWKWLRCAFNVEPADNANDTAFGVSNCSYVLIEDCWAYGGGRYKFSAYAGTMGDTHHIIFRRCLARFDRTHPNNEPISTFVAYRSQYVLFQNCISIDGDQDEFWVNYYERGPAFYIPHDSQYTYIKGSIVLNHASQAWGGLIGTTCEISNSVAWGCAGGWHSRGDSATYNGAALSNLTIGVGNTERDATSYGIWQYLGGNGTIAVTNSIFYDQSNYALYGSMFSSDYNALYANDANYSGVSAGAHDYQGVSAIDPIDGTPGNGTACLRYLPRIESGSDCDGTGSSGADRGANILYRIGTSGTVWGESGYDTITTESLWPWPNESRIKTDMAAYSYTGSIYPSGTSTLSGARGFATGTSLDGSAQTLTKYIWEYLGNQIPSGIYGGDTTAPTISNLSPSGAQSCTSDPRNVTESLTTNEAATCRAHDTETTWASMTEMTTTGGTSHSRTVSRACGASYSPNVLCQDAAANESDMGEWSYSVAAAVTLPVGKVSTGTGAGAGSGSGGGMGLQ